MENEVKWIFYYYVERRMLEKILQQYKDLIKYSRYPIFELKNEFPRISWENRIEFKWFSAIFGIFATFLDATRILSSRNLAEKFQFNQNQLKL